jgi:hypothetical protein
VADGLSNAIGPDFVTYEFEERKVSGAGITV